MPEFNYAARNAMDGREILSCIAAETREAAIKKLLDRHLLVVSIEERLIATKRVRSANGGKVALKDLVAFTRQLATMIDAGMAIVSSLKSLSRQTKSKAMRDVINDVCSRVEVGDNFSDALVKHPRVFDKLYIVMVAAGEKSGTLAESLGRLATYLESTARLRRKVKSAMMYPTVVTIVAVAVTIFLLAKVVPVFGEIYNSFKGKLPAPTQYLITFSNFMQSYLIVILMGIGAAVYGWLYFIKTPPGREFWDSRRIKLPIFGALAHTICLSRFVRTFASLLRSGVPILSVMESVSKACGNVVMESAVNKVTNQIQNGEGISDALAKHPIFPEMIVNMIAAGEQTGRMDDMMERVADHLDEEIEVALSGMTALIEPLIIVFLSVVVGTIVICMFLPIFKLSELVNAKH